MDINDNVISYWFAWYIVAFFISHVAATLWIELVNTGQN
jgi:hypothetical protein